MYFKELKKILRLATPIFLGQIAATSMGFVDTVVAGRAGAINMAAVALAASFWMPAMIFSQGILMPVTPLVGQKVGANKPEESYTILWQGLYLAMIITIPMMLILFGASQVFARLDVDPELARLAKGYLQVMLFGLPCMLIYNVFRAFMEGHGKTRPTMLVGFLALAINIPGNFIFVFGLLGFKAYGAVGCAIASVIVCIVMAITMIAFVIKAYPASKKKVDMDKAQVLTIFKIGLPSAFSLLCESSMFALISIFIAHLGTEVVAAQQVAVNFSSMTFMLPLSIGIATTIRSSQLLGAGNLDQLKITKRTSISFAVAFGILLVLFTISFRGQIVKIYTSDQAVFAIATTLLVFDAIFQLPDAIQIISACILRAYNDTVAIFTRTVLAYWVIGMPLGLTLAFTDVIIPKQGVVGFWIAIILALSIMAVLFFIRLRHLERMPLSEIRKKFVK